MIPTSVLDLFHKGSKISYNPPKDLEELESLNEHEIYSGYLFGLSRTNMTIDSTMTNSAIFGFLNAKYDTNELEHPDYLYTLKREYLKKINK